MKRKKESSRDGADPQTMPSGVKRIARRQVVKNSVGPSMVVEKDPSYNIWYGKTSRHGQRRDAEDHQPVKRSTRCNIARDSGDTRAEPSAFICLHFARGDCTEGPDCTFAHRIPNVDDEFRLDEAHDVFGRDRHQTDRADMGGVGSFSRENTTLYVGRIIRPPQLNAPLASVLERRLQQFEEFGPLQKIKVLESKMCAFVKFMRRSSAEFAKEAMAGQSLGADTDKTECLNVRWATEDPNQAAQARDQEARVWRVMQAAATSSDGDPIINSGRQFVRAIEQKQRVLASDEYPDTDSQYLERQGLKSETVAPTPALSSASVRLANDSASVSVEDILKPKPNALSLLAAYSDDDDEDDANGK